MGKTSVRRPDRKIVILGNLNTGKTVLFNRICGKSSKVGNYPGTSVEVGRGRYREGGDLIELIDTPGITNLRPESEDEIISRDILLHERIDAIAHVVDGKNMRKGLLLASQLHEYGIPLVMDINMMDEVRQRGIRIDAEKLSQILGTEVTKTVAIEGEGVGSLRKALVRAKAPKPLVRFQPGIEEGLSLISTLLDPHGGCSRGLAVLLLSGDRPAREFIRKKLGEEVLIEIEQVVRHVRSRFAVPPPTILINHRAQWADRVLTETVEVEPPRRFPFAEKIGALCRRPLTGIPIAAVVLFLLFLFVGKLGAEYLVGIVEGCLFGEVVTPALGELLSPLGSGILTRMFVGRFGLVSMGLSLVFGILLPVLFLFFIAIGILEESGYLQSLSILLDRTMRKVGLNGKGILPLILGFSCITMAVLSTKMLETRKERILATFLLVLGIPCAPMLGVMLVVLAPLSILALLIIVSVILTQIVLGGMIASRLVPGMRSDFVMELSPMRVPRMGNILHRAFFRTKAFIAEATPFFLLGSLIFFAMDETGLLDAVQSGAKPVITGLLGLPVEATEAFILTIVRREAGAAFLKELVDGGLLGGGQIVVALLVMISVGPCVNAALVIWKELGVRVTVCVYSFLIPWAIFVGTVVNQSLAAVGVSF
ncbi:MAG: FeoB small GTPase domain-containing protein [Planctomycetota bacterium]|jgi:ferrous iron transport protein B